MINNDSLSNQLPFQPQPFLSAQHSCANVSMDLVYSSSSVCSTHLDSVMTPQAPARWQSSASSASNFVVKEEEDKFDVVVDGTSLASVSASSSATSSPFSSLSSTPSPLASPIALGSSAVKEECAANAGINTNPCNPASAVSEKKLRLEVEKAYPPVKRDSFKYPPEKRRTKKLENHRRYDKKRRFLFQHVCGDLRGVLFSAMQVAHGAKSFFPKAEPEEYVRQLPKEKKDKRSKTEPHSAKDKSSDKRKSSSKDKEKKKKKRKIKQEDDFASASSMEENSDEDETGAEAEAETEKDVEEYECDDLSFPSFSRDELEEFSQLELFEAVLRSIRSLRAIKELLEEQDTDSTPMELQNTLLDATTTASDSLCVPSLPASSSSDSSTISGKIHDLQYFLGQLHLSYHSEMSRWRSICLRLPPPLSDPSGFGYLRPFSVCGLNGCIVLPISTPEVMQQRLPKEELKQMWRGSVWKNKHRPASLQLNAIAAWMTKDEQLKPRTEYEQLWQEGEAADMVQWVHNSLQYNAIPHPQESFASSASTTSEAFHPLSAYGLSPSSYGNLVSVLSWLSSLDDHSFDHSFAVLRSLAYSTTPSSSVRSPAFSLRLASNDEERSAADFYFHELWSPSRQNVHALTELLTGTKAMVELQACRLNSPGERVIECEYDATLLRNPASGQPMAIMFFLKKMTLGDVFGKTLSAMTIEQAALSPSHCIPPAPIASSLSSSSSSSVNNSSDVINVSPFVPVHWNPATAATTASVQLFR